MFNHYIRSVMCFVKHGDGAVRMFQRPKMRIMMKDRRK